MASTQAVRAGAGTVPALCFRGVTFTYRAGDAPAVNGVDLDVRPGEAVALVGRNGSGKSTVARMANGLLLPDEGGVSIGELDTADAQSVWHIRAAVGLLFQDPDDQIVGTTVADDVAFGLENLGVPRAEMRRRVEETLEWVGLANEAGTEPHLLSGGQKQRLALAGVLVLRPSVLVLDEPTSMLDPPGRKAVWAMLELLRADGVAVLTITQSMEEVMGADRVVLLERGEVAYSGSARPFFLDGHHERLGAPDPPALRVSGLLAGGDAPGSAGAEWPGSAPPLTEEELAAAFATAAEGRRPPQSGDVAGASVGAPSLAVARPEADAAAVDLAGVRVTYHEGTPFSRPALRGVDLRILQGCTTAVLGSTASGKSTLLMTAAGVVDPSAGSVRILGVARPPAGEVGMVFQRPETQLFSASVWDDVAVAPRSCGVGDEETEYRVRTALELVGLDPVFFGPRRPWELSAGEQRRVALAGVLSLDPALLILDEPGAGLDPGAREDVLRALVSWRRKGLSGRAKTRTLVFSTHEAEEAANFSDRAVLLEGGHVRAEGPVRDVLKRTDLLGRIGLEAPFAVRVACRLGAAGPDVPLVLDELVEWLEVRTVPAAGEPS